MASIDDTSSKPIVGAAIRNKGKFDMVQYLRNPLFLLRLKVSHGPNPLSVGDLPVVPLYEGVDAGQKGIAPRPLIIHSACALAIFSIREELR